MSAQALALIVSILLHLVAFGLLSGERDQAESEIDTIEVAVRENGRDQDENGRNGRDKESGGKGGRAGGPARRRGRAGKKNALGQLNLSPKFRIRSREAGEGNGGEEEREDDSVGGGIDAHGWSTSDWGVAGGDFEQVENFMPLHKLLKEIQGMVDYPGALGRRQISGTINARLVFTKDSECNFKKSWVKGAQPYLRTYIFGILRRVCALNTKEIFRFRSEQVADLSFAFVIEANSDTRLESERNDKIVGNVLMFERIFFRLPGEVHLGPITLYAFNPTFVYLDFPWILETWDRYVNKIDPVGEFREK